MDVPDRVRNSLLGLCFYVLALVPIEVVPQDLLELMIMFLNSQIDGLTGGLNVLHTASGFDVSKVRNLNGAARCDVPASL